MTTQAMYEDGYKAGEQYGKALIRAMRNIAIRHLTGNITGEEALQEMYRLIPMEESHD